MSADAIWAQAHLREAQVKAAAAAGRSQNKVREAMGVPLVSVDTTAE